MMSSKSVALGKMIKSVRACFQDLKALGDKLHDDLEVTASMRAVMEFLDERGEHTVPDIARAMNVSRQHIQMLVGSLSEKRFVAHIANPAHQRSSLVQLTDKGRKVFAEIKQRERVVLDSMCRKLTAQDIIAATQTIEKLRNLVNQQP